MNKKEKKMSITSNQGITLIALIITVIVMLILATLSIKIVLDGRLIDRTQNASEKYVIGQEKEAIYNGFQDYQQQKALEDEGAIEKGTTKLAVLGAQKVEGDEKYGWHIIFSKTGNSYDLDSSGKLLIDNIPEEPVEEIIKVGDYVNYEDFLPTVTVTSNSQLIKNLSTYSGNSTDSKNTANEIQQEKGLKWRILDMDNGKIRLISDTETTSKIALEESKGYNNAVYLIDEMCKELYSSSIGTAQNVKIEDIEKVLEEEAYETGLVALVADASYGDVCEITAMSYRYYPTIYPYEVGCKEIDGTEKNGTLAQSKQSSLISGTTSSASNSLKITKTARSWNSMSTMIKEDIYYELFIKKGEQDYSYWISSRAVDCDSTLLSSKRYPVFGVYSVGEILGQVSLRTLYNPKSLLLNSATRGVRPIVTLNSDVEIGDKVNGVWQIKK